MERHLAEFHIGIAELAHDAESGKTLAITLQLPGMRRPVLLPAETAAGISRQIGEAAEHVLRCPVKGPCEHLPEGVAGNPDWNAGAPGHKWAKHGEAESPLAPEQVSGPGEPATDGPDGLGKTLLVLRLKIRATMLRQMLAQQRSQTRAGSSYTRVKKSRKKSRVGGAAITRCPRSSAGALPLYGDLYSVMQTLQLLVPTEVTDKDVEPIHAAILRLADHVGRCSCR